ncbi:MAG: hypothetical protein ACW97A_10150 [Candidatus Thorarchaeota archaeon]|jgi:hypothetical protein
MQAIGNRGSANDDSDGLELTTPSKSSEITKEIVTAAVLAALSIAVTPIASYIPRVGSFGIALFDPVSFFWIIAFLIGGPRVGLTSMAAGTIVLNFFDPFAPFGPVLKFLATLPMVMIPWLGVKLVDRRPVEDNRVDEKNHGGLRGGTLLAGPFRYLLLTLIAVPLRLAIMIPTNMVVVPILFGPTDLLFIITYTVSLNLLQSVFDIAVPWLVVHPTGVYKYFKMW